MDQIIIKALLIAVFVVVAVVLLRPSGSARSQAIRTLGLLLLLVAAVLAVIFPGIVNDLAQLVGVGRGADLLLYGFLVVFISTVLSNARKQRRQDEQITELARKIAVANPEFPTHTR